MQLPVCFLAFRPNCVLEHHAGATAELMKRCVAIAARNGLKNAYWSGKTGIPGSEDHPPEPAAAAYRLADPPAKLRGLCLASGVYAQRVCAAAAHMTTPKNRGPMQRRKARKENPYIFLCLGPMQVVSISGFNPIKN